MPDSIETKIGFFWLEDGVLRFASKPHVEQDTRDATEAMQVFAKLAAGKVRPAVFEVRGVKRLTREARALYTTSPEAVATFAAVALVVSGSAIARALVNFTMTVSRPGCPVRMFENVGEAVAWARPFAAEA